MGDTRSWAADKEDENRTCPHGTVNKYFDHCKCAGCEKDRAESEIISRTTNSLRFEISEALRKASPSKRAIIVDRVRHVLSLP